MPPPDHHLAQLHIATMKAPLESPGMADFVANLGRIQALAEATPGLVWWLGGDGGDASIPRPLGENTWVNLSVWQDVDSLHRHVHAAAHAEFMRRCKEWFEPMADASGVLWWVPAGHKPSVAEALERLNLLRRSGPGPQAFSLKEIRSRGSMRRVAMAESALSPMRYPSQGPEWTPQALGLDPAFYASALRYLFDRSLPTREWRAWYWNIDEPEFEATPLQWTRLQTLIFARSGVDLAGYSNAQVGMGLNFLANSNVSDVPCAAVDPSVPLDEAMRMMRALPILWRECFGPRLASLRCPIGYSAGYLASICYMWFDVWYTGIGCEAAWRDAVWQVLQEMLEVPCREVQVAALHGIGHCGKALGRQDEIDRVVRAFICTVDPSDLELKDYAEYARQGRVL